MSERGSRPALQRTVVTAVAGALLIAQPSPTTAEASVASAGEGPVRITAPERMGEPVTFPTVDLAGGGVPLTSVSEDLDGTARVAEARDTVDVVLNGNVLFGKDSSVVRPAARQRLSEVIGVLRERGAGRVHVVGHTDDLGSAAHGLVLSRQRARSVRDILVSALDGFRITSDGKGEAEPRVPNTDEASRALNRRVEIHFEP